MESEKMMELTQRDLDGDLSPGEKTDLEAHLSESPEDAQFAAKLRAIHQQLEHLPKMNPPINVVDSILPIIDQTLEKNATHIESPHQAKKTWFRSAWLKVAGAVAAVVVIGWVAYPWLPFSDRMGQNEVSMLSDEMSMESTAKEAQDSAHSPSTSQQNRADIGAMDVKTGQPSVWSPKQTYQVSWTAERVTVRKASGELQYQSEAFMDGKIAGVIWESDRVIQVVLGGINGEEHAKTVRIDVEQKVKLDEINGKR